MKKFKTFLEDGAAVASGPTNTAGSGAVAGIGQPPGSQSGEPGIDMKKKRKPILMSTFKRNPPKL